MTTCKTFDVFTLPHTTLANQVVYLFPNAIFSVISHSVYNGLRALGFVLFAVVLIVLLISIGLIIGVALDHDPAIEIVSMYGMLFASLILVSKTIHETGIWQIRNLA